MHYILQCNKDRNIDNIEVFSIHELLKSPQGRIHTYEFAHSIHEAKSIDKHSVPIGDIGFVTEFLKKFYKTKKITPIEIPSELQTEEFLKRHYRICHKKEIQFNEYAFFKNASTLKDFSSICVADCILPSMSNSNLYVVSEVINILSEYRVFVFNNTIQGIQNYTGNCTVFPNVEFIKKAIDVIKTIKNFPTSYTVDIACTEHGDCLLEIHNFISCGTYGYYNSNLLEMYKEGIQYEINKATESSI